MDSSLRPRVIAIEGNIGAGKTTLLKALAADPRVVVAYEPIDAWTDPSSGDGQRSILELFYADKARYAFSFQMFALMTRVRLLLGMIERHPDKIIVCERSHLGDAAIFARLLHESGWLTPFEWCVYSEWHDVACQLLRDSVQGIVYLRATPDVCAARIMQRNRQGEQRIDLDYLVQMHAMHDAWLQRHCSNSIPVLELDGNLPQQPPSMDEDGHLGLWDFILNAPRSTSDPCSSGS
jgi:deoxyadenosine/deoxycytidine kinase